MPKTLTNQALRDAANDLIVELAAIRAVDEVESRGSGFTSDGKVRILFERHKFHQFTNGRFSASHPKISSPKAGGYGATGAHQYARFSEAFALDPDAAMKSASWGRYQIMGFNHNWAGFKTVDEFVDAMKVSEDEQLKAFVRVIKGWGLATELRNKDWAGFARQYNGAGYKRNKYDEKLETAYNKFRNAPLVTEPVTEETPEVEEPKAPEVKPQEPEPPAAPQAEKPAVLPVEPPPTSIVTKIAAGASAAGPVIAATGLKVGGVEFKTGGLVAIAAVIIVGMLVAAYLWNESQKRAFERQKLTMDHLADPDKQNVIAAGSKV